jgi:exodeoxyribonuclease (lambda-induced)
MILIECRQGTAEWLQARAGAITASRFADAISKLTRASGDKKAGDWSGVSDRYAADIAIERISEIPYGEPPKSWLLDRGHELEDRARIAYEARTGFLVEETGVLLTDDRKFGYSTDGMPEDGLIEIKCPIDSIKIATMWKTGDVSEYIHQMQGGMWITGRNWCDFIMYVPDLAAVGKDLFVKRIHRDDKFIDEMVEQLLAFDRRVQEFEALFRMKEAA